MFSEPDIIKAPPSPCSTCTYCSTCTDCDSACSCKDDDVGDELATYRLDCGDAVPATANPLDNFRRRRHSLSPRRHSRSRSRSSSPWSRSSSSDSLGSRPRRRSGDRRRPKSRSRFSRRSRSRSYSRSYSRSRSRSRSASPIADSTSAKHNPHVAQVFENKGTGYQCRTDIPFTRVLTNTAPRLKYRRRAGESKTVVNWASRRVLLADIEFLTIHGTPGQTVVYAAPGAHVPFLAELFPHLEFVVVDLHHVADPPANLRWRRKRFTDEIAEEFRGTQPLFVCDFRSAEAAAKADKAGRRRLHLDEMGAQLRWVEILKPVCAMLKFSLLWDPGQTEYLDGTVHLPVWGAVTAIETRLVVRTGAGVRMYDNTAYEEQMFHFNTVARVALYHHGVRGAGLDRCYDCTAEVTILKAHLLAMAAQVCRCKDVVGLLNSRRGCVQLRGDEKMLSKKVTELSFVMSS